VGRLCRDTTPVGAVLVDGSGSIVAEGENARYRPDADMLLGGSHLATPRLARSLG